MTSFRLLHWGELPYEQALLAQQQLVDALLAGEATESLILVEHPHVYTLGRGTLPHEVLNMNIHGQPVPLCATDRGGKVTYHGPGQLVAYVIRDMRSMVMAVRNHVTLLERSVLATLAELGLTGETHAHAPGVWVGQAKIAALGVRIRQGVAYHGVAINRCPDMDYFQGIIPCGIRDGQVTSLAELGVSISRTALEELYVQHFSRLFGPVEP